MSELKKITGIFRALGNALNKKIEGLEPPMKISATPTTVTLNFVDEDTYAYQTIFDVAASARRYRVPSDLCFYEGGAAVVNHVTEDNPIPPYTTSIRFHVRNIDVNKLNNFLDYHQK